VSALTATSVLRVQHRTILGLFTEARSEARPAERARLFARACEELAAHLAGEKAVFYPVVLALLEGARATVRPRARERGDAALRAQLSRAADARPCDPARGPKLALLERLFLRHVAAEERDVFPRVDRALAPYDHELLGAELAARPPPVWRGRITLATARFT
jgi:hypothetical protein